MGAGLTPEVCYLDGDNVQVRWYHRYSDVYVAYGQSFGVDLWSEFGGHMIGHVPWILT